MDTPFPTLSADMLDAVAPARPAVSAVKPAAPSGANGMPSSLDSQPSLDADATAPAVALRQALALALELAPQVMENLVGRAVLGLDRQSTANPDAAMRHMLDSSAIAMDANRRRWVQQFPALLRVAFAHPAAAADLPTADLRICSAEQEELDRWVLTAGSLRGNPLGPQSYVRAIAELLSRTQATKEQRQLWMRSLLGALGTQLAWVYLQLAACLRTPDSREQSALVGSNDFAEYAAYVYGTGGKAPAQDEAEESEAEDDAEAPESADQPPPPLSPEMIALAEDAKRTVKRLRQALGMPDQDEQPAKPGQSELDRMMLDIDEAERLMLMMQERGLNLPAEEEVVASGKPISVQVEKIIYEFCDTTTPTLGRVPLPVREAIAQLQEPMEALAAVDASVLRLEDHPARVFIDAIIQRSLRFSSDLADGFSLFFAPVQKMLEAVSQVAQPSAKVYEQALLRLEPVWLQADQELKNIEERKEQSLAQLEVRKQLASRLAFELVSRRDAGDTPVPVKQFLMGPWAQVLARAQLHPQHPQDEQLYSQAVTGLLWSVSTRRAGARKERLTEVLPRLAQTLQAGLKSVDQPQVQIDSFLSELNKLHDAVLAANVSADSADPKDDFDAVYVNRKPA